PIGGGQRWPTLRSLANGRWDSRLGSIIFFFYAGEVSDPQNLARESIVGYPADVGNKPVERPTELSRVSRRRASSLPFLGAEDDLLCREQLSIDLAFGRSQPDYTPLVRKRRERLRDELRSLRIQQ